MMKFIFSLEIPDKINVVLMIELSENYEIFCISNWVLTRL